MRPLNISGSQAKDYYYGKDPIFDAKDNSQWHGELAKQMGLAGTCAEHDFLNIIAGNDPNGQQIIKDGVNGEHRAAVDIPLAAPKSVSVMALHVGDKELVKAHHKAVGDTIAYLENNYIYARRTVDGNTSAFKTGNGLFSTFVHSTSRSNDPHLHTHTLIQNMTRTDKGWRAVFNDPIFKDQTLLNYVYQSHLSKYVRELGYEIANHAKGKWEIAGFKDEWIERFSTRTKEIDEALGRTGAAQGEPNARQRDRAQKSSRAAKDRSLTPEELSTFWQDKLDRIEIRKAVDATKGAGLTRETPALSAGQYVDIAYNAIHETESTFTRQDVVKVALEISRGEYTVGDIEKAFYDAVASRQIELLRSHVNRKGLETHIYTSRSMRNTEMNIVKAFDRHGGTVKSWADPQAVKAFIEEEYGYFTDGQKQVVTHAMTSTNRFAIVQGDAGTGKTSALEAVQKFSEQSVGQGENASPIEIKGLGYTGKASREIANHAGIPSQTLHSFLNAPIPEPSDRRKLWIVDESSMVGSRQMEAIMQRAVSQDARVIFVGDGKQLQAISAGRMFKDLQSHGHVEVVMMEEALRQKTDYMKAAVHSVKGFQNGKTSSGIDDAFDLLVEEKRVRQVTDRDERITAAAEQFLSHEDRPNCLIVTPINEDRVAVNEIIHNAIIEKDQRELTVPIRTPVYMNGTSRYFARSYEAGQKAFIDASRVPGIAAGQEVTIGSVDLEKNCITLSTGSQHHSVDLRSDDISFSVYRVEERSFFEGEKVVFLKNDKNLDLSNGQTATVRSIGPQRVITAKIDGQGREAKINLDFYPYIDRGYAVTVHKAQGQTAKDVIMLTDSKHPLNKTETFYVGLSRAQENFTLYADKVEAVKSQFKEAQPKTSTMELNRDGMQMGRAPAKSIGR